MAASAVSTTGRARRTVASTIAVRRSWPRRDVGLDLIDQDDRVAHDHAGERDQAEQRHEAERGAERLSASEAPMIPSGAVRKHQDQPREALQLDHQERQHRHRHDREHREHRGVGLLAISSIAPPISMR